MVADKELATHEGAKTEAQAAVCETAKRLLLIKEELVGGMAKLEGLDKEFRDTYFPEQREELSRVKQEVLDVELELEKFAQDTADKLIEIEKQLSTLQSELNQQRESGDTDFQEAKMLIASLEQEVRNAVSTLQAVHARVADLEAATDDQKAGEEDLICDSVSQAGSVSTAAFMGAKAAPTGGAGVAGSNLRSGPPPLPPVVEQMPGESSDSSEGEYTIPHTTGKLGANSVELIHWEKLREVRKKQKNLLNEIDKIKMRRLTAPPLRSMIKSWKRWKESIYYWVRDLRRVRVSFTVMGAQVLEQSFVGHDGEHAVAEQASPNRDIIEMMQALDLKFATPTRGMLEKFEEWVPLITRDDGVAPALFLHLLGMVFEAEKRIGGPRTEHSKVTRALAALRIHNDKDTIIRAQLTSEIEKMSYAELEHVIDSLQINDTTRYDSKGLKHEKQIKGTPDYLADLLGISGDRHGQGTSSDHLALNRFFSGAGPSAAGHVLQTRGDTGGGQHRGGGGATSHPGTPRGGPPPGPGGYKTSAAQEEEDRVFWETHQKKTADQKKTELAERIAKLRKQVDKEEYWCPYGDWCMKLRSTGFCSQQHSRPEYTRGRRKFERDHPEKYAEWLKRKKEQQSKEQREKNKAASSKAAAPTS
eukprot:g19866.t1